MTDAKVALVTGGSRGIGFETVKLFLEEGYRVATCAVSKTNLEQAVDDLGSRGELYTSVVDVSDPKQGKAFVGEVRAKFGTIDVLVNNAGVAWTGEFVRQATKSMNEIIDVNVMGVLYMTRWVLPVLLEKKSGTIINVASGAGQAGIARSATYSASKFAVVGFTESLAAEVEEQGVRVYAICPGPVATDMQLRIVGKKVGMPPEKIARAIVKLTGSHPPIKPGACLEIYR